MEAILKEAQAPDADQQSQGLHNTPDTTTPTKADALELVKNSIAINGSLADMQAMRKQLQDAKYVAGRLALTGQITVFYAGPNTGKTLISLYLVSEAIAAGALSGNVYHINLDDTYDGLITKGELGLRNGFIEVSPPKFPSPAENLKELVDRLISIEAAGDVVLILDTIKKFVDVMDKRASAEFMTACRRFTSAGGTILALAHTNKNKGNDEKSVPSGTSDILDDCDCAYTIDVLTEEKGAEGVTRTIEFTSLKSRGPVVPTAVYRYTRFEDADYTAMFNSVHLIDGDDADEARRKHALAKEKEHDKPLIQEICTILQSGEKLQGELVTQIQDTGKYSRSAILACLTRWCGAEADGSIWDTRNGTKNAKLHYLHPPHAGNHLCPSSPP